MKILSPYSLEIHGSAFHTDIPGEIFIHPHVNEQGGENTYIGRFRVIKLLDAALSIIPFTLKLPTDFVSFISVKLVWSSPAAAGNIYSYMNACYASSGEAYNTHIDDPVRGAIATAGANIINVSDFANPLTLANLSAGDYIGLLYQRDAIHANDTLNDFIYLIGLLFSYTANQ